MKLYLFNKLLRCDDTRTLIARAHELGIDGYHLGVREGYLNTAENVEQSLPEVAAALRREGLDVPMATSRGDLLDPDAPDARPLLRAMDRADVRLLKIGYFRMPRGSRFDYVKELDKARSTLARWEPVAREYGVKICYHSHASCGDFFLGSNASAVMRIVGDLDPGCIGVYLDTGHLVLEGEPFDLAMTIARTHLAAVALKDARWFRPSSGAAPDIGWEMAGDGSVDWNAVGQALRSENFSGPLSIHAEYSAPDQESALRALPAEVDYIRRHVVSAAAPGVCVQS